MQLAINELRKAEERFVQVKQLGEITGEKRLSVVAYNNNFGNVCRIRGDLKAADDMYTKSLAIFTSIGNKIMISKVQSSIKQLTRLRKEE